MWRNLLKQRGLSRLLAVTAACALFLSFYGPLLDHHFTERLAEHSHIYLGALSVEHVHPYEVPHSHLKGTGAPALLENTSGSEGKIIFLPPDEEGTSESLGISFISALVSSTVLLLVPPMLALLVAFGEPGLRNFVPQLQPPPPRLAP